MCPPLKAEILRQPDPQSSTLSAQPGGQAELARRSALMQVPGQAAPAASSGTRLGIEPPVRAKSWFDKV
ncbi:hypothetical protein BKE38_13480 [Pseudoroseomonas deserti]|uniref:Uncharacterized protein n=1 Tax=Teichococcus deserti TaxID=1817963 RepID=A0A1V2H3Z2_9PROT|nr:hypothetical protein [Pseudoroseomonas deserti]ONG53125.1 hypothetical protein BKE38_13480 [Pseudoroseomonas deserti]